MMRSMKSDPFFLFDRGQDFFPTDDSGPLPSFTEFSIWFQSRSRSAFISLPVQLDAPSFLIRLSSIGRKKKEIPSKSRQRAVFVTEFYCFFNWVIVITFPYNCLQRVRWVFQPVFSLDLPNFTGFYLVLFCFIGFYLVLQCFTGFYLVLLGFT